MVNTENEIGFSFRDAYLRQLNALYHKAFVAVDPARQAEFLDTPVPPLNVWTTIIDGPYDNEGKAKPLPVSTYLDRKDVYVVLGRVATPLRTTTVLLAHHTTDSLVPVLPTPGFEKTPEGIRLLKAIVRHNGQRDLEQLYPHDAARHATRRRYSVKMAELAKSAGVVLPVVPNLFMQIRDSKHQMTEGHPAKKIETGPYIPYIHLVVVEPDPLSSHAITQYYAVCIPKNSYSTITANREVWERMKRLGRQYVSTLKSMS